jgi:hypothetical protein
MAGFAVTLEAMNEHWDGEGQSSGKQHGCTQLRG